ncbi:hypothetical protein MA16_Dca007996 [Dendrobium catenatum]|uniref:Uncharacterized protein n=1 Tax=Dendrobium catenatum TaxID=906689 RepID=A0A2I0VKZ2_9ASPA|nr:hypothetical protein MA16_Dca007996 [Dendrobium catenatum]
MERNRVLSLESWANYIKVVLPYFKNLKVKPLIINEGSLLQKKVSPAPVIGKGKEILKEDGGFNLKSFNSLVSIDKVIGKFNLEASSSNCNRISLIKSFNFASQPSLPIRNDLVSLPKLNFNSRNEEKVDEELRQRNNAEISSIAPVVDKEIYVPKLGPSNSKKIVEPEGVCLRTDSSVPEIIEVPGGASKENIGADLQDDIPGEQHVEVTRVDSSLKILNKFDVLAVLEESNPTEAMENQEGCCAEEGEIVENSSHNMSKSEAMCDEKSKLIHMMNKEVSKSEKAVVGSLSSGKKVKLIKELKSLGSGNVLDWDRKMEGGKAKKNGGPSPIFKQ